MKTACATELDAEKLASQRTDVTPNLVHFQEIGTRPARQLEPLQRVVPNRDFHESAGSAYNGVPW